MRPPFTTPKPLTPKPTNNSGNVPSACASGDITPACLQALYKIPSTPSSGHGHIGVTGYYDQWASQDDLDVRSVSLHLTRLLVVMLTGMFAAVYAAVPSKRESDVFDCSLG